MRHKLLATIQEKNDSDQEVHGKEEIKWVSLVMCCSTVNGQAERKNEMNTMVRFWSK